jgi:hypothetical protein
MALYGFAAEAEDQAPSLVVVQDGLSHVGPEAKQALQAALQVAVLHVPETHGYFTFDLEPTVGTGGWGVLQSLVANGYVAMVEQVKLAASAIPFTAPKLRFSKNPLTVEESAGPGGAFAIVDGPSYITTTAEIGVKVPGPTWVFPVVVVGGIAGLIYLLRR